MNIRLLDGGMGQELIARAGDKPTPLWSTQVMMDHPGLVAEVHRDYFDAGATIATTNSYAIHRDRLVKEGIEDRFEALHHAAITEAKSALRDGTQIAGSIGPLVASYRPDAHPGAQEAIAKYTEVAGLLASHVDLILCESVASLLHANSVLAGARTAGLPVWVSFTVDDEDGSRLRSGEKVAEAAAAMSDQGAAAVLLNCSAPEAMAAGLDALAKLDLPFGAYANAFTMITKEFLKESPTADALHARRDMGPEIYADFALAWIEQGATIVGGCCETGPAHIAAIAQKLKAAGHQIV